MKKPTPKQIEARSSKPVAPRAVASIPVYHIDTNQIGVRFTRVKPVKGRVPVLFNGNTTVSHPMLCRLRNL